MAEPFLEMRGISRRFGATLALDGVDLAVEHGEVHALVGENGSGKSTLMRILAGALPADSGEILWAGKPFRPGDPAEARKHGLAMIHQELTICPHLSVLDNLFLGAEETSLGILKAASAEKRARAALAPLGLGELGLGARVGSLPISVRQLLEIARALILEARVVVLDEPTSSLTESDVANLFRVMRTLKERGCAVIYISHFLNEIREIADRMTILRDGKLVGVRGVDEVTDSEIVSMMVGREIKDLYPRTPRQPGDVVLELERLAGSRLPIDANLSLRRGEVLGIAGLNGSGRSELVRAIFGLEPVRSGTIRVGTRLGPASPHERWKERVGMLSEDRKEEGVALGLSISDNITLTNLPAGLVSPRRLQTEADIWVEKLSIKCRGSQQAVGELSGGNQQKVAIARMLSHGVDILLLDEPTRGIDVGSKEQIYRLIDKEASAGKAVLMVSSYLPELLGICDRIAVMRRGVLGEARNIADLTQESILHEAVGA